MTGQTFVRPSFYSTTTSSISTSEIASVDIDRGKAMKACSEVMSGSHDCHLGLMFISGPVSDMFLARIMKARARTH